MIQIDLNKFIPVELFCKNTAGSVPSLTYKDINGNIFNGNAYAKVKGDSKALNNAPVKGIKIGYYNHRTNSGNVYVNIIDPRGFDVLVEIEYVLDLLHHHTYDPIKGFNVELCYRWNGNKVTLVPVTSAEFKEYQKLFQHKDSYKLNELVTGHYYSNSKVEGYYLGTAVIRKLSNIGFEVTSMSEVHEIKTSKIHVFKTAYGLYGTLTASKSTFIEMQQHGVLSDAIVNGDLDNFKSKYFANMQYKEELHECDTKAHIVSFDVNAACKIDDWNTAKDKEFHHYVLMSHDKNTIVDFGYAYMDTHKFCMTGNVNDLVYKDESKYPISAIYTFDSKHIFKKIYAFNGKEERIYLTLDEIRKMYGSKYDLYQVKIGDNAISYKTSDNNYNPMKI